MMRTITTKLMLAIMLTAVLCTQAAGQGFRRERFPEIAHAHPTLMQLPSLILEWKILTMPFQESMGANTSNAMTKKGMSVKSTQKNNESGGGMENFLYLCTEIVFECNLSTK